MSLGSYDHIALELDGNPLGLESDDLVFEKSNDTHTAAILANVSGTQLCIVDVAGAFGRDLSAQGEAAMVDFASEWLAGLYGAELKKAIGRTQVTRWNHDPFTLGAWSAAVPGSQFARRQFLDPIADGVWYAGEAAHETLWGTVSGAWETGERAADAVLRRLGPLKSQAPAQAEAAPKQPAKRARTVRQERREEPQSQQYFGGTPSIMRQERVAVQACLKSSRRHSPAHDPRLAAESSSAAAAKACMLARRLELPVSRVITRSVAPAIARQVCPAGSP